MFSPCASALGICPQNQVPRHLLHLDQHLRRRYCGQFSSAITKTASFCHRILVRIICILAASRFLRLQLVVCLVSFYSLPCQMCALFNKHRLGLLKPNIIQSKVEPKYVSKMPALKRSMRYFYGSDSGHEMLQVIT